MRATELRIGNLVAFNHKYDIISKVEEIQQHSVRVSFDTQPNLMNALTTNPENFIPIPLTEEWLLKFGFKDLDYTLEKKCKTKKIIFMWSSRIIETRERLGWICKNYKNIKYVHELQNLYFALTGEELILNEKL